MKVRRVRVEIVTPGDVSENVTIDALNELLGNAWDGLVMDWRYPIPTSDVVEVEGDSVAEYEEYSAFEKVLDTD